jgi:two-component sensor histidine kinase
VQLPPKSAVVLGMAFHELATNAVKHGALSLASGQVQVDWKVDQAGDKATLTIEWCELGGPLLDVQPISGFGSRLLRQTIIQELAGELDVRFEREGVCCTISVPIGSASQQAA